MLGKIQPGVLPARVRPARRRAARRATSCGDASPRWPREIERGDRHARTPEAVAEGFIADRGRRTWPTRSRRSRSRAATTSPATRCSASAAPAASTPACVADALGMTRVFIHPLAGVLSAYGMGLADQSAMREAAVELPLADAALAAPRAAARRARRRGARPSSRARASARGAVAVHRRVHLRYEGTDSALVVPFGDAADDRARGVRGRLPAALRLPDARARADRRGGVGRGGRRRRRAGRAARTRRRSRRRAPAPASGAHVLATAAGTTPRWSCATSLRPGDVIDGPGDHRRAQRHDRRRARLAGARHRARPPRARADGAARSRAARSAPRSTRCCSRCSTTCS